MIVQVNARVKRRDDRRSELICEFQISLVLDDLVYSVTIRSKVTGLYRRFASVIHAYTAPKFCHEIYEKDLMNMYNEKITDLCAVIST